MIINFDFIVFLKEYCMFKKYLKQIFINIVTTSIFRYTKIIVYCVFTYYLTFSMIDFIVKSWVESKSIWHPIHAHGFSILFLIISLLVYRQGFQDCKDRNK